jgi:hypothetical protein
MRVDQQTIPPPAERLDDLGIAFQRLHIINANGASADVCLPIDTIGAEIDNTA